MAFILQAFNNIQIVQLLQAKLNRAKQEKTAAKIYSRTAVVRLYRKMNYGPVGDCEFSDRALFLSRAILQAILYVIYNKANDR